MSNELDRFGKPEAAPVVRAETAEQVDAIAALFAKFPNQVTNDTQDGANREVISKFGVTIPGTPATFATYGDAYLFRDPSSTETVYCQVNNPQAKDTAARVLELELDLKDGIVTDLAVPSAAFTASALLDQVALGATNTLTVREAARQEEIRSKKHHNIFVAAAVISVLGAVGVSIYNKETDIQQRQAADNARQAFDNSNFSLRHIPNPYYNDTGVVLVPDATFATIPSGQSSDDFTHARTVSVVLNSCTKLPGEIPPYDYVILGSSASDPSIDTTRAITERVGTTADSTYVCVAGRLLIGSSTDSRTIAVQAYDPRTLDNPMK